MEPQFVVRPKVVDGKGEARLAFEINKYDINLGLGNNRSELEAMLETLTPVLKRHAGNGQLVYHQRYGFGRRLAGFQHLSG